MDWFEMWFEDKQCMIDTMVRNMQADLNAGYNYFGNSITQQREMIDSYKAEIDKQLDKFATMANESVNRWCYYDMKKRGVIS